MENLWLFLKTSAIDLSKNKLRTALTSLGILIGVMAVVLLLAFGQGLKNFITQELENLGANVLYVYPGDPLGGVSGGQAGGGRLGNIKFDDRDLRNLQKAKLAEYVVPVFIKRVTVKSGEEKKTSDLYATTPEVFKVRDLQVQAGRLLTEADVTKRGKVAVLGPKIAEKLFGNPSLAVGKTVRTGDSRFTVVGVTEAIGGGGFSGPDYDSYTYVPFTAASSFNPKQEILSFYVSAYNQEFLPGLKTELETLMGKRYDADEFSVIEQKEILALFATILGVVNSVLVTIGSISLLVGGIGIMNIMYASVNERIKEIGIRRALGATKGDIRYLFLSEAVMLAIMGGLAGLSLAVVIVVLIQPWYPASITSVSVVVAIGVASAIGIFFGVFPATQAANRSPIEAIRYE